MVRAFWSYRIDDDRHDRGMLTTLAQAVRDEFAMIAGAELELFIDTDLAWGDDWRDRIEAAVASAAFFIPVLTPRYFQSTFCREEFLAFVSKAKRIGLADRVLSLLYVPVPDLSCDAPDALMALAARYQHQDITALRAAEPHDREFRATVRALARSLLDLSRAAAPSGADPGAYDALIRSASAAVPRLASSLAGFHTELVALQAPITSSLLVTTVPGPPTDLIPLTARLDTHATRFAEDVVRVDTDVRAVLGWPDSGLDTAALSGRQRFRERVTEIAAETAALSSAITRLTTTLGDIRARTPTLRDVLTRAEGALMKFTDAERVFAGWVTP
ncbi:toll/interleukin-1 receptor domain-containing protein [Actinokineospora fastidiosa]|uniref:TIR domain-containing protein n=1 Tax=Actinokineospora fastidiosa TaxID=1816 RepID=A0A918G9Z6_9PSEU|nr:toll/interleukin-1 receptor domain-containing protein [Actinokineospora fastidiosa]GGS25340.1 hypothetical protein GCM10010171_18320 [Actinokineospora fastidiosa]